MGLLGRPEMDDDQNSALVRIAKGESLLINGVPGSGKTTLLRQALVNILDADNAVGWSPVLVLTPDRRRAVEFEKLAGADLLGKVNSPGGHRMIRSVNSFAYLVISQWLVERADSLPRPKLAGGADEDIWFTTWVSDHFEKWEQFLPEPVLQSASFRMELRNLIARVGEAGISPAGLREIGEIGESPLWKLAADAYSDYVGGDDSAFSVETRRIDAARIQIIAAGLLRGWASDSLEQGVTAPIPIPRYVLVDDLQDCTAATFYLIQALIDGGACVVATASSLTATAAFRGGQADLGDRVWDRLGFEVLELNEQHRIPAPAARILSGIRQWVDPHRDAEMSQPAGADLLPPVILSSDGRKGAYLANSLREQHYLRGTPWERQAIIVRAASDIEVLRRQLQRKNVPLAPVRRALRFSQIPVCVALLKTLAAGSALAEDEAEDPQQVALQLVQSPLIGMDMLQLFQVLRLARAAGNGNNEVDLLMLLDNPDLLAAVSKNTVGSSVIRQLQTASKLWAVRSKAAAESAQVGLWTLWSQTDRADSWLQDALVGGWEGDRADERLDAVISLFRKADLWEQQKMADDPQATATAASFARELLDETVESDSIAETGIRSPGVEIVTVAQSAGREWDVVFVTGLQDGRWPTVARPSGILNLPLLQRLVEVLQQSAWNPGQPIGPYLADPGLFTAIDGRSFQLTARRDEARLLANAVSRASDSVYLVAVENEDDAVSPFLNYLARQKAIANFRQGDGSLLWVPGVGGFDLANLTGTLRYSTMDPGIDEDGRHVAAVLLAVMADQGISAADPRTWTGAGGVSTDEPILEPSLLKINPSHFQTARDCLLKWFLGTINGQDQRGVFAQEKPDAAMIGTLIHDLAEHFPKASAAELQEKLAPIWQELDLDDGTWWAKKLRMSVDNMIQLLGDYQSGVGGTVETELPFQIDLGESTVKGRIDRVEYNADGTVHIVDIKTGKAKPTKKDLAENAQLATYQLALMKQGMEVSGASLLTIAAPAAKGNPLREQAALSAEAATQLESEMIEIAQKMVGPDYVPNPGEQCRFCSFQPVCPAMDLGMRGIE